MGELESMNTKPLGNKAHFYRMALTVFERDSSLRPAYMLVVLTQLANVFQQTYLELHHVTRCEQDPPERVTMVITWAHGQR
jgi:hypothetical protein